MGRLAGPHVAAHRLRSATVSSSVTIGYPFKVMGMPIHGTVERESAAAIPCVVQEKRTTAVFVVAMVCIFTGIAIQTFTHQRLDWFGDLRPYTLCYYLFWGIYLASAAVFQRVRFTSDGIEHRTWYGKNLSAPYSQVSVVEMKGDCFRINLQGKEIVIPSKRFESSEGAQILRSKVRSYLVVEPAV